MRALVALCALALASPALAEDRAPWRAVDAETGQIRDIDGLDQLARDFPDSGSVRLRLLQPLIAAGEIEKVLATLEWLYDRGYVFSDAAQAQIPKLLEGVDAGRIAERLIAQAEVIEASEIIAILPAQAGLTESVVKDPRTDTLAVTSQSGNSIWQYTSPDEHGQSDFGEGHSFSGIVYRPVLDQLWASVSGVPNPFNVEQTAAGLISLCLELECSRQVIVIHSQAKSMNDLVAATDGTLYASDSVGGGVYRLENGANSLEPVVPPGTFRSPQGLAVSPDGARLYVSDYRYGIAIVELATGEVSRLTSDIPLMLDGVDGLWRHGNELIAVQNGTSPMRISAFTLSGDGNRVVGHRILEQAHSEWTEPLSGSIDEGALIYIGNGQWDRFVDGRLADGKQALPTEIRRLPLGPAAY